MLKQQIYGSVYVVEDRGKTSSNNTVTCVMYSYMWAYCVGEGERSMSGVSNTRKRAADDSQAARVSDRGILTLAASCVVYT